LKGAFDRLPVVDVAALFSTAAAERRSVGRELDRAARTAGFLYVTGHGIAPERFVQLQAAAAEFFAQPDDVKMRHYIGNSRNHRGYVPPGEEVFYGKSKDLKEAYDLALDLPPDDADYLAGNRLLGPNVWPPEVPSFQPQISAYYDAALVFGRTLVRGFALGLGLDERHFDALVTKPPTQLRLVHYPPNLDVTSDSTGIGAHTDYECFTILHTTAPGLEVLNARGEWIDAPPVAGALVVNIGDLFEALTNGAWPSTTHRVRKVTVERYSFPLFFNLDYATRITALPGFLEVGQPPRYPELVAGEHLLAQTIQSFSYLQRELAAGKVALPERTLAPSSFGHASVPRPVNTP